MPVPKWVAQVNKRFFNKMELARGTRPVITHTGRSSGKTFRTPLDAHRVGDGFIFILNYGSDSDWVQNILAAGSARLTADGTEYALTAPRLINAEAAWERLPPTTKAPPRFLKVTEFLQMDVAQQTEGT